MPLAPEFRRCLGALLGLVLSISSLSAQITGNTSNYLARVWRVEQGLPQNKVTAVIQTRDGYLWTGTYGGLARFDGVKFQTFDEKNTPVMHSRRVTALYECEDGTLWIGFEDGAVATFKNGKFEPDQRSVSRIPRKIVSINSDRAGDVWLLSDNGILARARDGLTLSPQPGNAAMLLSLTRDSHGDIWVARDGLLSKLERGKIDLVKLDPLRTNTYVQGVCGSKNGGVWVASDGRLRRWEGSNWVQDLGPAPWSLAALTSFVETRNGVLLAGTSANGCFVLYPQTNRTWLHFDRNSGAQSDWILSLLEDCEGSLWVGTGDNGLVELRETNVKTVTPSDHWRGRAVLSVLPDNGSNVWIGTEGAGLYHYTADGSWENFGYTNGIGNSYVWSIATDAAEQLYVGTWGGGLFVRAGDRFNFAKGLENVHVRVPAMMTARDGTLWVGTDSGLLHYDSGRTNWFNDGNGQPVRDVRAVAEAADGTIWFGMAESGLAQLDHGNIRRFTNGSGLSSGFIECLYFDADGALWIGTFGGGLCRLKDGHFSTVDSEQGLPSDVIDHIEEDGLGYFWMSSDHGIIRVRKMELDDCADGKLKSIRCLNYGINDGLPTIQCSEGMQPSGCKTSDGRLWFPTSKGLVVVDPTDVRANPLPPPMAMEGFIVDGKSITNVTSALKIPPGQNHFEFHYTALSLVAPEKVQFKYRLEGLEKDWQNAGARREAIYNFLEPRDYVFRVIACNNDGVWNEEGISVSFKVLPHFWQTWWFHLFGGLATVLFASGVVWFDARRRMRRRLEKLEREKAIERERARIAKDIHDDLGASLTRITMLSQSTRADDEAADAVNRNLERIFGTARESTRALDEIVWAVNPRHDTLDSLANYLTRFAQDFLQAAKVRCRLNVPLQLPAMPVSAETRHNLFLAFKEALNNVVKHAAASEVRVEMQLEDRLLRLVVEDNGKGFNPADALPDLNVQSRIVDGNGLLNMTRRVSELGGTCTIESESGHGTKVILSAPLS